MEGGRGDAHLAAGRAAGRPRGAGLRHAGDALPRQQAARVHAAPGAERQLHEGKRHCALCMQTGFFLFKPVESLLRIIVTEVDIINGDGQHW